MEKHLESLPLEGKVPAKRGNEVESGDIISVGMGEASSVHLISRRCRSLSETRHRRQLSLKGKPLETQASAMSLTSWHNKKKNRIGKQKKPGASDDVPGLVWLKERAVTGVGTQSFPID